ncbi:MAG: FIST C-terminal domain-containing protein [Oscillospiraceae bacterium]|jgi:hypothetical protein|nr:FIST C-terminal domain-containing protein [Oscillospiraceae bacterium]
MIKMFSAFTEEVDDVETAISEILEQLDIENKPFLKNTLGIIHCFHEFIDSGVIKAISEELPFDVVGITTPYVCLPGKSSSMGLMLNVFTSDCASFTTCLSETMDNGGGNLEQVMNKLCDDISAKLNGEPPTMLMAYGPFMHVLNINGDEFVNCINNRFPNIPIFGAFAFSEEIDFSETYTLYNGESYSNAGVLVAITGDVQPSFLTIAIPEKNMLHDFAIVTKSTGNILNEIDGISVEEFAISKGLIDNEGNLDQLYTTPMIAKLDDGSQIIRVCIGGDGQGGAVMGGHVPEGAKIVFSIMELSDIISTSSEITKNAMKLLNSKNMIIYSCMARLEFLGPKNRELEANTMCKIIGDSESYFYASTGGEIYPQFLSDGKVISHLQNYSLVVCIL